MDAPAAPLPAVGHVALAKPRECRQARRRPGAATNAGQQEIPGFRGTPRSTRRTKCAGSTIDISDHQQVAASLLDHSPNHSGVTRAVLLAAPPPPIVGERGGEAQTTLPPTAHAHPLVRAVDGSANSGNRGGACRLELGFGGFRPQGKYARRMQDDRLRIPNLPTYTRTEPVRRLRVPGHGTIRFLVAEAVASGIALGLGANGGLLVNMPLNPAKGDMRSRRVRAEGLSLPRVDASWAQAHGAWLRPLVNNSLAILRGVNGACR